MSDANTPKNETAATGERKQLKEWATPELVVEDVQSATHGGVIGTVNSPGDDVWYQS